jgi:hypothetical protein
LDTFWVCESHPAMPWDGPNACSCGGAGMPCPACNEPDRGERPRLPAGSLMPLTMRPTKLSSPVDKGRVDFTVYCGAWAVGRIYEHLEGPEHLRWFWALNGMFGRPREIKDNGHAPTLDEAKAQFEAAWQQWLEWAKLLEKPQDTALP